uniref:Uncharacterized protein n=1 Tax=Rhizophora mucronata TaxID=61149 RepID=A0A2P2JG71_RHIMU
MQVELFLSVSLHSKHILFIVLLEYLLPPQSNIGL